MSNALNDIKLLFVCNEDRATSYQRRLALQDLGVDFDVVYTSLLSEKVSLLKRIIRAVAFRSGYFPERNHENAQIKQKILEKKYDILFIEKGLSIKPSTLKFVKGKSPHTKILSYTLDDMMNRHNSSRYYLRSLPLYDFNFTNKRYNVEELKNQGAKNVFYFRNGFSPKVHRPIHVTPEEKAYYGAEVSFIGTYEPERVSYLLFLAQHHIRIKIWGWSKLSKESGIEHPNITNMNRHVYDDEYSKVICASKINLGFLRKSNRDTETTRSVEIPACRGFMLAERTMEHQELFTEGKEAEYFGSHDELLEKMNFYLNHEDKRDAIAQAGLKRCTTSGYDYNNQLQNILSRVLKNE